MWISKTSFCTKPGLNSGAPDRQVTVPALEVTPVVLLSLQTRLYLSRKLFKYKHWNPPVELLYFNTSTYKYMVYGDFPLLFKFIVHHHIKKIVYKVTYKIENTF
jgi:hypothetical protein